MKNKVLYVAAAASFLLLQSCKRDYVCTCVSYNNGVYSTSDTTIVKAANRDAIYHCDQTERQRIYNFTIGLSTDTVLYCNLNKN